MLQLYSVSQSTSQNQCHKYLKKHRTSICLTLDNNSPPSLQQSSNNPTGPITVTTSNATASPTQQQQTTEVGAHEVSVLHFPTTTSSLHSTGTGSNTSLLKTPIGIKVTLWKQIFILIKCLKDHSFYRMWHIV